MWVCPKCGREFKKANQGHYCGKVPKTVLQDSVPCISERIIWSMPCYKKGAKYITFSACKNHISFYAGAEAIEEFSSELNEFVTKKNAIYFPYNKALPAKLIINIAKWCLS